jgi:hypothetical protein
VFSRFTASARRVMQRAFREAKRWQHDFVGTEHLLYGLLCDADGPAVMLLRSLNAKPDLMLEKVEFSLQRHEAAMAMEQFPLSPASKRVFCGAAEEAALFQHQMIGPEHLLLALLRESDCEAAQILSAHGVFGNAVRNAVATIAPDTYREAQIQANEGSRVILGENPSADELEGWIAPLTTHEELTLDESTGMLAPIGLPENTQPSGKDVEAQLRRTQTILGIVLGFALGFWLDGWMMASVMAMAGLGIASFRSSWVGIFAGVACGLFIVPLFHTELSTPLYPVLMGILGGFLGSFLGDAWRSEKILAVPQLPPQKSAKHEPTHDAVENRQRNNLRPRR